MEGYAQRVSNQGPSWNFWGTKNRYRMLPWTLQDLCRYQNYKERQNDGRRDDCQLHASGHGS